MIYFEKDNVIYRGPDEKIGPVEMLVGGKWVPGYGCTDVRAEGSVMTEAEAREFQGEGWPADTPADKNAVESA